MAKKRVKVDGLSIFVASPDSKPVRFDRVLFRPGMLGKKVDVVITDPHPPRWFETGEVYTGRLSERIDWLVGCPVFEMEKATIGVSYGCEIIKVYDYGDEA